MKEDDDKRREGAKPTARGGTGPRTRAGKAISRMNALKTGVTSSQLLLPGERRRDLQVLDRGLRAALRPVGMAELVLVDGIVMTVVRLRRIEAAERSILTAEIWDRAAMRAKREANATGPELSGVRDELGEDAATDEERRLRSYNQALEEAAELSAIRDGKASDFGVVYVSELDTLDRLMRHRTAAERSLERSLHELMRLQDRRLGRDAPAPSAVDVTMILSRVK